MLALNLRSSTQYSKLWYSNYKRLTKGPDSLLLTITTLIRQSIKTSINEINIKATSFSYSKIAKLNELKLLVIPTKGWIKKYKRNKTGINNTFLTSEV